MPGVELLSQAQFASFVQSKKTVIVQVGSGIRPFLKGLVRYFRADLGSEVRFGFLDRRGVEAWSVWSRKHLASTAVGVWTRFPNPWDGYHLYRSGRHVCFHSDSGASTLGRDLAVLGAGLLGCLIDRSDKPLGVAQDVKDRTISKEVIAAFEAALEERDVTESPIITAVIAPPDPYVVLGISPQATDDEVRAAFRKKQLENHPDRVAHMDPAIQQVAADRSRAINEAHERIIQARKCAS